MRHRYHRTLSEQSARRTHPRLSRCSSRLHSVHAGSLLQVVGTHNSYHQAPPEEIQDLAYNPLVDAVAASYAQSAVNTTQYSHLNFYEQLELGKHLIWYLHLHACLPQHFIRQPLSICSMNYVPPIICDACSWLCQSLQFWPWMGPMRTPSDCAEH